MRRRLLPVLACTAALAAVPAHAQAPERAGVTAAVNPDARGTPPALPTRTLEIGLDMVRDELVETGPAGQAQLLFLDGSSLTVAADSSLTIDEFAYDPTASTGSLAMSVAKGTLRFVGGRISKGEAVEIETPTAVIGIRGGVALLAVDAATGTTNATLVFGDQLSVQSKAGGGRVNITRPGYTTTVAPQQEQPSPPAKATTAQLTGMLGQLEGRGDATGGTATPPSDTQVAAAPVAQTNQSFATAPAASGPAPQPAAAAPQAATESTQDSGPAVTPEEVAAASDALLPRFATYALANAPSFGAAVPFVRAGAGGNLAQRSISPLFAVAPAGDPRAAENFSTRFFQVSLASQEGTRQSSLLNLAIGIYSPGNDAIFASFVGTSRSGANVANTSTFIRGNMTGGGAFVADEGFYPDGFNLVPRPGFPTFDGTGNYTFNVAATRTSLAATAPHPRSDRTISGYATSVSDTFTRGSVNAGGAAQVIGSGIDPNNFSITTAADSSRIGASMALSTQRTLFGSAPAIGDLQLRFGAQPGQFNSPLTAFFDDRLFAARESYNDTTGAELSTVNGRPAFGGRYLVTAEAAPVPVAAPAGVGPCECAFVQWGWWGGDTFFRTPANVTETFDRTHLGTWVAGSLMAASDMPNTGTASFAGHAVGTIVNNAGTRSVAVGGFGANYNFGSRSGTATISDFGGGTYNFIVGSGNGRDVAGTLSSAGGTPIALQGSLNGSFFGNAANPAAEIGGQFTLHNGTSPGGAAGVFLGAR
ncbi:MAG TPA: FecR domain-containing protein [Alphaproteobacteria bacterium]|nr:FecR domain-containing protein [Alphaproteobacteria bacterium]